MSADRVRKHRLLTQVKRKFDSEYDACVNRLNKERRKDTGNPYQYGEVISYADEMIEKLQEQPQEYEPKATQEEYQHEENQEEYLHEEDQEECQHEENQENIEEEKDDKYMDVSSDEYEKEPKAEEVTPEAFGALCLDYNVSQAFGTACLHFLHKHPAFKNWPLDIRTVLKSMRGKVPVVNMEPGIYYHFGLMKQLVKFGEARGVHGGEVELQFNVDGLPLRRSSGSQFWPVMCRLFNVPQKPVFVVGLYHGYDKPKDFNLFMKETVDDVNNTMDTGLTLTKGRFGVVINAFICDAPAKACVLNVNGHSACNSCTKCHAQGCKLNNRMCFPTVVGAPRTHNQFISQTDRSFHHGESEINKLKNVDIIKIFKMDYLHIV